MTRRRPRLPAAVVDDGALVRETPLIRAVLGRCGVRARDLDDATQDVLIGAWRSIAAGRFHPPPDMDMRAALRRWLVGVAWRQASHYCQSAYTRHEIPGGQPEGPCWGTGPMLEDQLIARALLGSFHRLPRVYQEVLALTALGASQREMAEELGIPANTAATRRRRGRQLLRKMLGMEKRGPPGEHKLTGEVVRLAPTIARLRAVARELGLEGEIDWNPTVRLGEDPDLDRLRTLAGNLLAAAETRGCVVEVMWALESDNGSDGGAR